MYKFRLKKVVGIKKKNGFRKIEKGMMEIQNWFFDVVGFKSIMDYVFISKKVYC